MPLTAKQVYRDYVTDGVPSSGNNRPKKSEIRSWGAWLESFLTAIGVSGGSVYNTRSQLFADLVHNPNDMAWVIQDPIVAYNGIYRKNGNTGTGSWTRVADLPYSFIEASNTGAGSANAIQADTVIPISESALVLLNIVVTNTASPVTVAFNGGSALTIKTNSGNDISVGGLTANMLVVGRLSGTTFRLISDQVSSAVVAAAEDAADRADAAATEAADYAALARNDKVVNAFTGDGVAVDFALTVNPGSKNNITVNANGATMLRSSYSLVVVGSTPMLRFSEAPAVGLLIEAEMGYAIAVGAPGSGSVGTTQLADDAVTFAKMQNVATATFTGRKTAGTGDQESLTVSDAKTLLGITDPVIVDRAYAEYLLNTSFTAQIPLDDTIPQNTEGTQILGVTITPKSTTNRLRARVNIVGSTLLQSAMVAALFSDVSANAIRARQITVDAANYEREISFEVEWVPGSTATRTITVRVGPGTGTTMYTNGNSSGRIFGGASACTLVVEELKA